MINKFTAVLLLLLCFCTVAAQDTKKQVYDLIGQCQKVYMDNPSLTLHMTYSLFAGATSKKPVEKYEALLVKKGADSYTKINKTEFLKIKNKAVKVDNESSLMRVDNVEQEKNMETMYDIKKLMANFSSTQLSSEGNVWVITLTTPAVTFVPYSKALVFIDKTKHTIIKQVLYLLTPNQHTDGQGRVKVDYPRLEVTFSPPGKSSLADEAKISLSYFVQNINGQFKPSKNYKGYRIVD